MRAIIISHEPSPPESPVEIHRFVFQIDTEFGDSSIQQISLRTARVIVDNLPGPGAFAKMLRAIVTTDRARYDSLLSRTFLRDNNDHELALEPDRGEVCA
ncbi:MULTISPECIES: hypothetical protein [unclassified Caballeronia]|uniref:hypothetical protein n=1 Tax=unclassified Caballeronia TaxID=2646786 RepID=UPI0020299121|nr:MULTISPECIES: hypothetical protein [unclassified Caballeronia]